MHINKLKIKPNWTFVDEQGNQLSAVLFELLEAIKANSKLTAAAKSVDISYRSAWNLITQSSELFGAPLVELHRGKGANLSLLGEKLLWSKHRVTARLGPQLDNLTSELNIEIQQILADVLPSIRIHASHGYAVALLPECETDFQLDLQYKSIEESLAALKRGDCEFAGFDVPIDSVSEKMTSLFRQYLNAEDHVALSFVRRQQGLMVQSGNPKQITNVKDLVKTDIRFINRQKESGTRAVLEELLKLEQIREEEIKGYADEEYTHSAVAAFIAAGMADAGLGIEAAARHFNLEFYPLVTEHYLFVCHKKTLNKQSAQQLVVLLQQSDFIQQVAALPGYTPEECGKIKQLSDVFPWF